MNENKTSDKHCSVCGDQEVFICGRAGCPRGNSLDKEQLLREIDEAHGVLDKQEISRVYSMDGGTTWPSYTLAERVNIVCGALAMVEREEKEREETVSARGLTSGDPLVDGDLLCAALGIQRTEGGSLNIGKMVTAIKRLIAVRDAAMPIADGSAWSNIGGCVEGLKAALKQSQYVNDLSPKEKT